MAINVSGKNFQEVTPGTVQGVCYAVWDLGFQLETFKSTGEEKVIHKVVLAFEVNEKVKDGERKGKPLTIYKEYTASLGKKANLRKDLVNWRGKDFTNEEIAKFDLEKLIGQNVYISVVQSKSGSSIVGGYTKLSAGMPKMKPENDGSKPPKWVTDKQAKQVNEDGSPIGEIPDAYRGGAEEEEAPFPEDDPNEPGF